MRHAWPAKQCCWLGSSRYPYRRRIAVTNSNNIPNTYPDANGNGYADSNGYGHGYSNSHRYCYCYANSNSYAYH